MAGFELGFSAFLVCLTADLDLEILPYYPSFDFWLIWDCFATSLSVLDAALVSDFFAGDWVTLGADTDLLAFESGFEFLSGLDACLAADLVTALVSGFLLPTFDS